ncbi:GTPase IMAP family member 8-like isoform X2 [Acanthochromis polyacanthus]|uniref:GTPase IMAP family member 8-like isoform X2 n=1 Tax=Acanthochromis polyacanthus TaxID=80966 RepID=UPI002234AB92|nr:GTPase IMAP family member 8-like isoform X2 [Acanthochromis polyacanthus]
MDINTEDTEIITLPELRIVIIGGRWGGKSCSGNTILRKERFECGRTRTIQSEVRHGVVEGRKLTVVDAAGWSSSLSLTEIPEGDKQRFKLNPSKCPPGPNAFLLVIPIDSAFSVEQRKIVEDHMKLLGERVWRYTMVLFTCGDFLGGKTVEQHIESEGDSLKWVIGRCKNRYHVFNNKEKTNTSQVSLLLEKIDEMVWHNNDSYYEIDEQTFKIIREKQQEVAERARKRRTGVEEQRQHMMTLIQEEKKTASKLQMILLGSRSVGKTSVGNTILGFKEQEDAKRTAQSVARRGFVGKTEITLVDTPGWWKGFPAFDTPEAIKEEVMRSMFLCPPGPHVFLLMIDADASFNGKLLDAATTHMELLGEGVWRHTVIVFTRGDWLGTHTIEEYIEGEGEALQRLVEQCGNRYNVLNNKDANDGTQVTELLETITGTVAGNGWKHFVPDEQIFLTIEERRRRVEEAATLRQSQIKARRTSLRESSNKLQEMKIMMLGQKRSGKSATGNTLLRKQVFDTCPNEQCQVEVEEVSDQLVTVIDTPGWWKETSRCTEDMDKEIVRGLSLSPPGVHAVLLVVPLDLRFRQAQLAALEDHMNLFDEGIWKHTMVLFTYGDNLEDKSVEEHIEREHSALRWLVDKCENRYYTINNMKKADMTQVTELFEKVEEMVAGNSGQLFCPDMKDVHLRIDEKFKKRELKHVLKKSLEQEYRRRELELMISFKEKLLELQADIRESVASQRPRTLIDKNKIKAKGIGQKKKDEKEEKVDAKINREIEKLDKDILTSTILLRNSKEFLLPDLKGESSAPSNFDKVLNWISSLKIGTNTESQLTLNFSETSGYASIYDFNKDMDMPK